MIKIFLPYLLLLTASLSFAQSDMRIHAGVGLGNDVSSYFALDYGNYLLKEDSKFNIGAQLGIVYFNFNNDNLTKDGQLYASLSLILKYELTSRFTLQLDTGSRIDLGKSKLAFNDVTGNLIPDTEVGNHKFFMPLLSYSINDQFGVFLGYQFVFEKDLDLNTLSVGLFFDLSSN
jgi:hypothetical protein